MKTLRLLNLNQLRINNSFETVLTEDQCNLGVTAQAPWTTED